MDTLETKMPAAEEIETVREELEKERVDNQSGQEEDEEEEMQQIKDLNEVKAEKPTDTKTVSSKNLLHVKPNDKKQTGGLNINNEVVKMRKEVKRVRALTVRKLTRQIQALKKKKGKDTEVERNQRRAMRLLEEIHAMKVLSADLVTKTALQRNLNFEQVCKNPKSTITDRAVTRIATHPQFRKRIEDIKGAMAAFKEERIKAANQKRQFKEQNQSENQPTDPLENRRQNEVEKEKEEKTPKQKEVIKNEEAHGEATDIKDKAAAKPKRERGRAAGAADKAAGQIQVIAPERHVRPLLIKGSPDMEPRQQGECESDEEAMDEEEDEYFDDSTEERFHRQSSSEESDDEDEFFIGKVSKFKKKKKKANEEVTAKEGSPLDLIQNEPCLFTSGSSLQSVFCSSLSVSEAGLLKGRGRHQDEIRGPETPKGWGGSIRNLKQKSKLQKQKRGTGCSSGFNHKQLYPGRSSESQLNTSRSKGRGQQRGNAAEHHVRSDAVFHHQKQNTALHPSWEASKKRKEQQGQILAFQGKKIKFDDLD